jgi:hypothetical protein
MTPAGNAHTGLLEDVPHPERRPVIPPPPVPLPPLPKPPVPEFVPKSAQTAPLAETEKPKVKKVKVHPKPHSNTGADMDAIIAKLMTLDPKSQQLVGELVDRLSK